jgi:hypothetical protein
MSLFRNVSVAGSGRSFGTAEGTRTAGLGKDPQPVNLVDEALSGRGHPVCPLLRLYGQ